MLKIMKNDEEIFRAWLRKYLADNRGMNRKQLAKKLNMSASKLSYILTGRTKESGERYFQKFPFELRQEALAATGVSYAEAIRIGQDELNPIKNDMRNQIGEIVRNEMKASLAALRSPPENENVIDLDHLHWKVVEKFQQKDKALQINQELVELEAMDPLELNGILQYIETRKEIVAKKQEAERKKRDGGSDQGQ
jgi:transcriptional regulator with XRE-family HTH domain